MAALNGIKGRDCMFSRLLCDDIVGDQHATSLSQPGSTIPMYIRYFHGHNWFELEILTANNMLKRFEYLILCVTESCNIHRLLNTWRKLKTNYLPVKGIFTCKTTHNINNLLC
uniref:Uncharacterized protein n=1 Tax=Solanum lycopersicum TaxID=4081 RepID=K4BN75_SOLLC